MQLSPSCPPCSSHSCLLPISPGEQWAWQEPLQAEDVPAESWGQGECRSTLVRAPARGWPALCPQWLGPLLPDAQRPLCLRASCSFSELASLPTSCPAQLQEREVRSPSFLTLPGLDIPLLNILSLNITFFFLHLLFFRFPLPIVLILMVEWFPVNNVILGHLK